MTARKEQTMKKLLSLGLILLLIFGLNACSPNKSSEAASDKEQLVEKQEQEEIKDEKDPIETEEVEEEEEEEEEEEDDDDGYVPMEALPEDLPIYPGAYMWLDTSAWRETEGFYWSWAFDTDASAEEIMNFYRKKLEDLGFEIDEERTFERSGEFHLTTTCETVSVGWGDGEPGETAQTPDRDYILVVNLTEWEKR